MTLPGVTPYPPEFAARYRARGYWADRPLIAHFLDAFEAFADRVAVIDDTGTYTYAELAGASQRVALNLLDLGLRPTNRVVPQLPNTRFFASLYFGLQRIGAIPIMALPSHRYRELRQFVGLSGAVAAAAPATAGDTDFAELHRRVAAEHPGLRLSILQGGEPRGRITTTLSTPGSRSRSVTCGPATCSSTRCRSRTTCRSPAPACRASC